MGLLLSLVGPSVIISSGDEYVGELLTCFKGVKEPF